MHQSYNKIIQTQSNLTKSNPTQPNLNKIIQTRSILIEHNENVGTFNPLPPNLNPQVSHVSPHISN